MFHATLKNDFTDTYLFGIRYFHLKKGTKCLCLKFLFLTLLFFYADGLVAKAQKFLKKSVSDFVYF